MKRRIEGRRDYNSNHTTSQDAGALHRKNNSNESPASLFISIPRHDCSKNGLSPPMPKPSQNLKKQNVVITTVRLLPEERPEAIVSKYEIEVELTFSSMKFFPSIGQCITNSC